MGGKLGVKSCTQAPEAVRVIDFDLKLLGQLPIDRFDDLAHLIEEATNVGRDLSREVGYGQFQQTQTPLIEELVGQFCAGKTVLSALALISSKSRMVPPTVIRRLSR